MILDTSAVVAIAVHEPVAAELLDRIEAAPHRGMGTPTLAETGLVLAARLRIDPRPFLTRLLTDLDVEQVPFLPEHWHVAVQAFRDYGKGRHRAGLNMGDCLSYATARVAGRPLLCVGNDFSQTDLELA